MAEIEVYPYMYCNMAFPLKLSENIEIVVDIEIKKWLN